MNASDEDAERAGFAWPETRARLAAFAERWPDARADAKGQALAAPGAGTTLWLPFLLPPALPGEPIAAYAARLPDRAGRCALVLLQAGAMACGYWDEDDLLEHKASKRYVVRGSGKAQATHLKTRGKSRYGSRLRLSCWQRLREETNAYLREWWERHGAPEQVLLSVPVRVWPELFTVEPTPPFGQRDAFLRRVPLHVRVPDFAELLRVRRFVERGRIERPAGGDGDLPSRR